MTTEEELKVQAEVKSGENAKQQKNINDLSIKEMADINRKLDQDEQKRDRAKNT